MKACDLLTLPWTRGLTGGRRLAAVAVALLYVAAIVTTMAILGPRGDAWWVVAAVLFLAAGFALGRRAARQDFERVSHTTDTQRHPNP